MNTYRKSIDSPRSPMPAWGMLALLAFACSPASASEGFRLSGFGSLGYAYDSRSEIAPFRDVTQDITSGSNSAGWLLDSRLGVQIEYNISPVADLVGQVVLRDKFHADVNNSTELAYAAIRPRPDLDLRLGRVSYDAFLMSDYRDVSYAMPWVRPPSEFYGWLPVFSVNGMDAAYSIFRGDSRWRIKAQAGSSKSSMPIGTGYNFSTHNLFGASVTRQTDSLRIKAAYSQFTIGSEVSAFDPLHQGLDAVTAAAIPGVSAEAADLRNDLSFMGAQITYTTLGAAFDDGVWIAQGELGYSTSTAAVVPHGRVAYLGAGHRFGDWMPFLTLSASRPGNSVRSAGNDWGTFNDTLRDPAFYTMNTTRIDQDTISIGVNWQVRPQATLKLQWDSTQIKPSGYGLWWREKAMNSQNTRINLISSALDFTF